MGSLSLLGINKSFGSTQVLHDVNLQVDGGELVVFVGPSGCGKSTLLRIIAGLEAESSGEIRIDDSPVNHLSPTERKIAMVFQTYALYPHLTVRNNMSLGLKQAKHPAAEIKQRVAAVTSMLALEDYLERRPAELSGGQRQRVAIGRAVVREPSLFLFDEPLSNLDAALRVQTRLEIAKLHRKLNATMVYVTHDQIEAMTLADRIVVLNAGRVEQVGTPMELYNKPANRFVASFIGSPQMNFLPADALQKLDGMQFSKQVMSVGVPPENVSISTESGDFSGLVTHVEQLGGDTNVYVDCDAIGTVTLRLFGQATVPIDSKLWLSLDRQNIFQFDDKGQVV